MTTRRYTGTCQCGRVRFEIAFDAMHGNSILRSDSRTVLIRRGAFRLLSGAADLEDQQFVMLLGHNQACRHCGVRPFGKGHWNAWGGGFFAINLAALDRTSQLAG